MQHGDVDMEQECSTGIQHERSALAYRMDMQNGHAWWTNIVEKHHGQRSWTCSMDIQRQAVWTCSMNTDTQHEHGYAAWTWHGHEAKTWTCSTATDMHIGHCNVAQTWTYCTEMDMQHGHGHAAWTWTCSRVDTNMRHVQGYTAGKWTLILTCKGIRTWTWIPLISSVLYRYHEKLN